MAEDSERMKPNRSQLQTLRAMRRLLVARLYLRGMTIREIRLALAAENLKNPKPGQVNPRTLEPWSISTLHGDIKLAEKGWERRAAGDAGERRRRLVAELREHRREAWRLKQLSEVRLGVVAEAKLDGLEHPQGVDVTSGGQRIPIREIIIARPPPDDGE